MSKEVALPGVAEASSIAAVHQSLGSEGNPAYD
jgi:hypothetical protein